MRTSWILIAPVLCGQVRERRLHGDEPVEQVLLVVLEADVQHVGLAAGGDVARHLERHRRLAGALRATDQQQLAGAEAGADRLVERREAERDGLVLGDVAGGDLVVEVDEDVQRRARRHAAVVGIEAPAARAAWAVGHVVGASVAHAVDSSPDALTVAVRVAPRSEPHSSTRDRRHVPHRDRRSGLAARQRGAARPARRTSGRSSGCPVS